MITKIRTENIKNRTNVNEEIRKQIYDCVSLELSLISNMDTLTNIAECWTRTFDNGGRVFFVGNGGSAADAQHFAAELAGKYYLEREPLPAIALTTNSSVLTAIGNDYGYDLIFARQIKALAKPGDVVVGISTSGNSPNVLKAMAAAHEAGAVTVAFTGMDGKLKEIADIILSVASRDTPRIQEVHETAGHIICSLVERSLFEHF
jgi:D-sedoheptulose 7-phosphate isomerase